MQWLPALKIGFPVALKASAPDILHKTGHGLVELNVNSEEETIQAYDRIQTCPGKGRAGSGQSHGAGGQTVCRRYRDL